MASQKQIDANRRNAGQSTGPKTEAGKAKSRCNALRDGITGQLTTLPPEDLPAFEQLKNEIVADFRPQTGLERRLANAIAWDTWRLDRVRSIENTVFAIGRETDPEIHDVQPNHPEINDQETNDPEVNDPEVNDPQTQAAFADARTLHDENERFERTSLYESRLTRNLHRNIALLRELQSERKRHYQQDRNEEIQIARLCEFNDMPIHASTTPSKNGFLFSTEEIACAAVRDRYVATADWLTRHTPPKQLFGGLLMGVGDTMLDKNPTNKPLSFEEYRKFNATPLETHAINRLTNPEDYGVRPS